jgi:hypothetical protein
MYGVAALCWLGVDATEVLDVDALAEAAPTELPVEGTRAQGGGP